MEPMEPIGLQHKDAAAATLAEAFSDDPLLDIVAPDRQRRAAIAPWFMGLPLEYGLRYGRVWANEDTSAVAVWFVPGATDMTPPRMLRIGMARVPMRLGLTGTRRFATAMSATEKFHKEVEGPHWYLVALGTRPERQGEGLGSALVELGTSRADDEGIPCYLETGTASNIAYYTKRGFEVLGHTEVFGHTLTGMVRRPR